MWKSLAPLEGSAIECLCSSTCAMSPKRQHEANRLSLLPRLISAGRRSRNHTPAAHAHLTRHQSHPGSAEGMAPQAQTNCTENEIVFLE